ncbi:MAG: PHA/PHB synthase family protein [Gammaproteobacteria bacterium]
MTDSASATSSAEQGTLGFANLHKGLETNFKACEEIMRDFVDHHENLSFDPMNLSKVWADWLAAVSLEPQKLVEANMSFWQETMKLYQQSAMQWMGQESAPVISEQKGDRRFKHDDWVEQPVFATIKQSYLLASQWMRDVVSDLDHLDDKTAQKVEFFTERFIDAMSPTNFAATNPAVLEKVVETKGANLVHGLKNMLEDLEDGNGQLRIRMTDTDAFELGKNVAVTPGKVVYQNRMFQLIQYSPTTENTFKRPLLIVPPWINKFYILDLQPKNSKLRWLVEQGHTVFVISWVNPDSSYRDTGFDDYVKEGVIEAVNAIEKATGESEVNAIGYCIGGTLLATTLAYMKARDDARIKSATFYTTMLDFSEPGELGVFIDDDTIEGLEKQMAGEGYLEGTTMAGTFNLLRANDLIWSFYVNNYLLGNEPRPFDLLYWNSDSTRMPCAMHSWYLRRLYLENALVKGEVKIDDVTIDLERIDIPTCFVSTADDHIAPWKSTYMGAQRMGGSVKFILGGSGHIAGIINPPEANKYGYRTTTKLPKDADAWAAGAEVNEGSWWPEWQRWIKPKAGKKVPARVPGEGDLKAIEDAPGSYVQVRIDEQ